MVNDIRVWQMRYITFHSIPFDVLCRYHLFCRMPETASIHFQVLFLVASPEDNPACFLSLQTLSEIFYSLK